GSVRHVEVFRMRSVGTLIFERPRPLSRQRRANHLYTLICEEPLMYRSTRDQLKEMRGKFLEVKQSGRHRVSGWEGESDMAMDENLGVIEDAYIIAAGTATVAAVAALESLLIDLVPDDQDAPSGLHDLLTGFLDAHGRLSRSKRRSLIGKELKIGKRRNQFAHALMGSYFDQSNASSGMFTEEALEETFYVVASLAIEIEKLQHDS
ncbi:hypothetical protein, partial [Mycobacteroides abscessus]|uniref:hypothetical protein n=1 Tax=Mycobacteroides abscessus TaxID=36809 RepID=UPI002103809D